MPDRTCLTAQPRLGAISGSGSPAVPVQAVRQPGHSFSRVSVVSAPHHLHSSRASPQIQTGHMGCCSSSCILLQAMSINVQMHTGQRLVGMDISGSERMLLYRDLCGNTALWLTSLATCRALESAMFACNICRDRVVCTHASRLVFAYLRLFRTFLHAATAADRAPRGDRCIAKGAVG